MSIAPSRQQAPAHPLLGTRLRLYIFAPVLSAPLSWCCASQHLAVAENGSQGVQHCLCALPACNLLLSVTPSVWGKQCCAAAGG